MAFYYLNREARVVVDLAGDLDCLLRGRSRVERPESCVSTSANGEERFKNFGRGECFIIMPEPSILIQNDGFEVRLLREFRFLTPCPPPLIKQYSQFRVPASRQYRSLLRDDLGTPVHRVQLRA